MAGLTQAQIQALASGSVIGVGSANQGNNQTIIVSNPGTDPNGNCLSCDEGSCEVGASTGVAIDLGAFKFNSPAKVRLRITNGSGSTVSLPLAANWTGGDANFMDPIRFPESAPLLDATMLSIVGFDINGIGNGTKPFNYLNKVLTGGAVVASVTVQANTAQGVGTANQDFVDQSIELVHYRIDPNNGGISRIIYEPFCDACFTTNNSDTVTHKYTVSAPITWRDILTLDIPTGASNVIVEYCFAIIDVPNTDADNAAKQMQ